MPAKRRAKTGPMPLGLGRPFSMKLYENQERWVRREARRRKLGLGAVIRELLQVAEGVEAAKR